MGAALEDVAAFQYCARGHVAKSPDLAREFAARLEIRAELLERWAFLLLMCHACGRGQKRGVSRGEFWCDAGRTRWLLGAEEGGSWVVAAKKPAAAREQNAQWLTSVKIVLSARWLAKNALWIQWVAANCGKKRPVAAVKKRPVAAETKHTEPPCVFRAQSS